MAKLSQEEKEKRKQERRQKKWEKEHKIINGIDHKVCSRCKEYFPSTLEYFYNNPGNSIDGLKPYCIECDKKDARDWQVENYERAYEIRSKHYKTEKRKLNNQRKRGKYKERESKWRKSEKGKERHRFHNQKRKSKNHIISKKEWEACKNYFNNSCAYCGLTYEEHKIIHNKDLHKEHVIDCGRIDLKNCVPSCQSCNSEKHTFTLNQWFNIHNQKYTYEKYLKIVKWMKEDCKKFLKKKNEKQLEKMRQYLNS